MYASLLFSPNSWRCFYWLYAIQLRYYEYPVCPAVPFPQRHISLFGLFALEERKRQSEVMQYAQ